MAPNGQPSLAEFSKVVEAIYDCTLDASRWNDTLRLIAAFTNSCHAGMGIIDHGKKLNINRYGAGAVSDEGRPALFPEIRADKSAVRGAPHV